MLRFHPYAILNWLLSHLFGGPTILCFHRVKDISDNLLDRKVGVTSPALFRQVLQFMKSAGYTFVPLETLVEDIEANLYPRIVAVTFDDGFKDLYQNAYPVLERENIPFTLFATTSLIESRRLLWLHKLYICLDKAPIDQSRAILSKYSGSEVKDISETIRTIVHSEPRSKLIDLAAELSAITELEATEEAKISGDLYLSSDELNEMLANGLTLEIHGHEHWPLTDLTKEDTIEEIATSVRTLENLFKSTSHFYALPYGTPNVFIEDLARQFSIKGIVKIQSGRIGPKVSLYNLPRTCILDSLLQLHGCMNKINLRWALGRG